MKISANKLYHSRFRNFEWVDHLDFRGQRPDTPSGNPKKYHRLWSKNLRSYLKRESIKEINSYER